MAWIAKIKRSWLFAALTLVVVSYLMVMWKVAAHKADTRLCTGIMITVHDTAQYRFVTPEELALELGTLPSTATSTPLSRINIDSLEHALMKFDKIESVNVTVLTNGKIHIDVHPTRPVARIFEPSGNSYYISRDGKRIVADARYHIDVPVVSADFNALAMRPTSIIPLVDKISSDSLLNTLVSMIKIDSPTDIILIPMVRGHVINIGDTLNFDDKFRRLRAMYTKVMPVRGWEMYDTLSVKWGGQVVASRREKKLERPEIIVEKYNWEDTGSEGVAVDSLVSPVKNDAIIPARRGKDLPLIPGAPPDTIR